MTKDFLGLRKFDEDFKKLDRELSKGFTSKAEPQEKRNKKHKQAKPQKLINNKDAQAIKTVIDETKKTANAIYKLATKNKIPKEYDQVMAMRDRLALERKQKLEIEQAKQEIKQMQEQNKAEAKAARKEKLDKIKSIFGKVRK